MGDAGEIGRDAAFEQGETVMFHGRPRCSVHAVHGALSDQAASQPPSTTIVVPVLKDEASLAR